jgi:hypothetical protein
MRSAHFQGFFREDDIIVLTSFDTFMLVPAQALAIRFLATFQDYPPREDGEFSLERVMEKLEEGFGSQ